MARSRFSRSISSLIRSASRGASRGKAAKSTSTSSSSSSSKSSGKVSSGSASARNTFRGNVKTDVKQSGSSRSGDVIKGSRVSVSASGGEHVRIGEGTPRTPRTPRAPRTPGSSAARVPATPASSSGVSSARLRLYMARLAAGESLPPSAARNPELVAEAKRLLGLVSDTGRALSDIAGTTGRLAGSGAGPGPDYRPGTPPPPPRLDSAPAPGDEELTDIALASARKSGGPPDLKHGDRGAYITHLQHYLKNRGFDPGPIDGIYGPKTESALKAFQFVGGNTVDWGTIAKKSGQSGPSRGGGGSAPTGVTPAGGVPSVGGFKPTGERAVDGGAPLYALDPSVGHSYYRGRPVLLSEPVARMVALAAHYYGGPIYIADSYRTVITVPDSEHRKGNAIDLDQTYYGGPGDPKYQKAKAALEKAGLKMLAHEWWHFSIDGT